MRGRSPVKQDRARVAIVRPANLVMACCAVTLGAWLAGADVARDVLLLLVAVAAATAFGNVVNDIRDIESDRVSHPDRPLVLGALEWVRTLIAPSAATQAAGLSGGRMTVIIGGVAAFTLLSALVFRARSLRIRYRTT